MSSPFEIVTLPLCKSDTEQLKVLPDFLANAKARAQAQSPQNDAKGFVRELESERFWLHLLVDAQYTKCIRYMLCNTSVDVDSLNPYGHTPLMQAAKRGRLKSVRALVKYGRPNIHFKCKHGHSALLLAAQNGHTDIVQYLYRSFAPKLHGRPLLEAATAAFSNKHFAIARMLRNIAKLVTVPCAKVCEVETLKDDTTVVLNAALDRLACDMALNVLDD